MAETFSPVLPSRRWGICSFVSAINGSGLVLPKTAAAAADFRNERRLTAATIQCVGSSRNVSSTGMRIIVAPALFRLVIRLVEALLTHRLNVLVTHEVVIDGRKIFFTITFPNC